MTKRKTRKMRGGSLDIVNVLQGLANLSRSFTSQSGLVASMRRLYRANREQQEQLQNNPLHSNVPSQINMGKITDEIMVGSFVKYENDQIGIVSEVLGDKVKIGNNDYSYNTIKLYTEKEFLMVANNIIDIALSKEKKPSKLVSQIKELFEVRLTETQLMTELNNIETYVNDVDTHITRNDPINYDYLTIVLSNFNDKGKYMNNIKFDDYSDMNEVTKKIKILTPKIDELRNKVAYLVQYNAIATSQIPENNSRDNLVKDTIKLWNKILDKTKLPDVNQL